MELVSADVLVWRAHFQSRAKERFQEHTLLYHAVGAFEACMRRIITSPDT